MNVFNEQALEGETAVVTGASRGLGRAIAWQFAMAGADVVVAARSGDALAELVKEIETETDSRALDITVDVRNEEDVATLAEEATTFGDGSVEILVANAGANFHVPVSDMSPNAWETIVDINLTGTFLCCHEFADALSAADIGRVITLSSVAGRDGYQNSSHYAASKSGIEAFTRTLAMEWAEENIRVNCVRPGLVATPGVEENRGVSATEIDRNIVDRSLGHPDEIADLILFLVSPGASYITGQTYTAEGVSGGEL